LILKEPIFHKIGDIDFRVVYSRRRTLSINVLPDSSVIVRVPYLTSLKTIHRIVEQKSDWIVKHRDSYKGKEQTKLNYLYINGEKHLFHGNELILKIEKSKKTYCRFYNSSIEVGLEKADDSKAIKRLLYKGYKYEATVVFPEILSRILSKYESQMFRPNGLIIRTMKRRWGSCSNKGIITLSTELIKLPDQFIEYVIIHELCHLRHHHHGSSYYNLLSELYPDWKTVRKELRKYIQ
jgi:hypothetical protein